MLRSTLPGLLLIVSLAGTASAQLNTEQWGVHVTAFLLEDGAMTLKKELLNEFRTQLELRGIPESAEYQTQLLLDAKQVEIGGESRIILSVSRMEALPGEVVDLGAENQAFYLRMSMNDLPPEGKFVRQEMSRDWMKQFFITSGQELFLLKSSDVERIVSEYVDDLISG